MTTYNVLVKTGKKKELIHWDQDSNIEERYLVVETKEPPVEGKANIKVRELVARLFKIPIGSVTIKRGFKSKRKVVEIS